MRNLPTVALLAAESWRRGIVAKAPGPAADRQKAAGMRVASGCSSRVVLSVAVCSCSEVRRVHGTAACMRL